MSYNRFLELVARKKSGDLSLPEQRELQQLFEEYPSYKQDFFYLEQLLDSYTLQTNEVSGQDLDKRWQLLSDKMNEVTKEPVQEPAKKTFRIPFLKWSVAAMLTTTVLFGWFYFLKPATTAGKQNIVSTKRGSKTKLVLPDGSLIWVNSDSRVIYKDDFGKKEREVWLTGEAYFDVMKDAKLPFVVHTKALSVKVLGTAFNIKAYTEDESAEATVIRGSVEVTVNNEVEKTIVLNPNEKAVVQNRVENNKKPFLLKDKELPIIVVSELKKTGPDSTANETQWVQNRVAFVNQPLDEIAMQLSRWYDVDILIQGNELKNKEYSGIFEDESVSEIIEALRLAGGFHYKESKKRIVIEP